MDCEIKDIVGYIVVTVILIITESLPFLKNVEGDSVTHLLHLRIKKFLMRDLEELESKTDED